jgi:hypothetical protein
MKRRIRKRDESGVYMIELIMSIAASSLLSAALVSNLAQTQAFSNSGQNHILAACIAQEQVDNARNTSFADLMAQRGTHELLINRKDLDEAGPPINPRPLLLDLANLDWTDAGRKNIFDGSVTEDIENGPFANTLLVTIQINWVEGPAHRNYVLTTLVSQNGIHN